MRKIWKWTLTDEEVQRLELPVNTTILSVQAQDNKITLWGLVDTECGCWTGRASGERCNLQPDHAEIHQRVKVLTERALPTCERVFRVAMTGQGHGGEDLVEYIGTVQLTRSGPLPEERNGVPWVVHIFEEEREEK